MGTGNRHAELVPIESGLGSASKVARGKILKRFLIESKRALDDGEVQGILTLTTFSDFDWLGYSFLTRKKGLNTLARELGFDSKKLILMNQTHGNNVQIVGCSEAGKVIDDVDGLITKEVGIFLGISTADCVPILFADPTRKIIGVAHVGWRGTINGIAENVVEAMKGLGSEAKDILTGLGPSIGPCHFEVREDVGAVFKNRFDGDKEIIIENGEKIFIDLRKANKRLLTESGISSDNIEIIDRCTYCDSENFFSYRRNKSSDRQISLLGIKC